MVINNGGLIFIAYKTSGIDNWGAFKKIAIENYGSGFVRHVSKRYNNYIWQGRKHTVTLEYDKITRSSILLLASIL